jgi:hypothetical protein
MFMCIIVIFAPYRNYKHCVSAGLTAMQLLGKELHDCKLIAVPMPYY